MAAASPRKRTTSSRKPTAPKSPNLAAFETLRERAQKTVWRLSDGNPEPFVVPGFDPPIEAHWPRTLADRDTFHTASSQMNFFAMLRILLAPEDYVRVLAAFDELPDSGELLIGLTFKIIDHYNGPGASDAAPGGYTAS
ncbi:hypothetical protein [Nocardia vaccinii]|uniref:hypothetical protein n=1 Tax=Nocardia vaccinii TaxID=1822 RepID=UPI00083715C3|nr:hypothetical protein [Nocardia vaccinii]